MHNYMLHNILCDVAETLSTTEHSEKISYTIAIYASAILVAAAVAAGITGLLCHLRHKHQRRRGINGAFYGRIVDISFHLLTVHFTVTFTTGNHIQGTKRYNFNDLECSLQSHGIFDANYMGKTRLKLHCCQVRNGEQRLVLSGA